MKQGTSLLLSLNGGYVDTAGFLALQGLFTAHVTGNFVTFGAALVNGTSGAFAKLLALPVFCLTILLTRMISLRFGASGSTALKTMLGIKVLLLALAAALALAWGPFPDGDTWRAILTGMILVCAMAIQNASHRVHLPKIPPSTLMTGTTTQIMLDLADLLSGSASQQQRSDIRGRLKKRVPAILQPAVARRRSSSSCLAFTPSFSRHSSRSRPCSRSTSIQSRISPDANLYR